MICVSDILLTNDIATILDKTDMGLETIEFSISDNLDRLEDTIKDYRQRLDALHVPELYFHGPFLDLNPFSYDSQIRRVTEYRFSQSYEAAVRLGAKKIIFHTCFVPSIYFIDGWAERMADFFHSFLADRTEIQVLIENVYDPSPEPIVEVIEMVKASNFMLCLDIGHANCYSNIPVSDWISCFGANIGHVHVHDNDGQKDSHLGLGSGSLNAEQILKQLRETAPNTTYTIECASLSDVLRSYALLSV